MRLDNGKISERQCFRMGILENITLGIVVIPYICTGNAGKWHYMAFALGLVFTFLYSLVIYGFSKAFPDGMIEEADGLLGRKGKIIDILYCLRYLLRASLIILFFSVMLRGYMLRSFNVWTIIISFTVICGYGASKDIEKRGRLLELLFWWMIIPLILVAVFSVSNVDWELVRMEKQADYRGILRGAYLVLIIMSSIETMLFTLTKVRRLNRSGYLKSVIWIIISVLFSYIFVQGIIGDGWAKDSSMSVLYVMEAAGFPGGIQRFDYAVVAFFLIGVFSVVSGYMFYAKEFLRVAFSKRWNVFEKENKSGSIEVVSDKWWIMIVVMLMTIIFSWFWSLFEISGILADYLILFDLGISLLIPLSLLFIKMLKGKNKALDKEKISGKLNVGIVGKKTIGIVLLAIGSTFLTTGCKTRVDFKKIDDRQSSLESMDYAVTLTVRNAGCEDNSDHEKEEAGKDTGEIGKDTGEVGEDTGEVGEDTGEVGSERDTEEVNYYFEFEVADLSDYKGDSGDMLSTRRYESMASDLKTALDNYYAAKEKHLDLGHLKLINLYGDVSNVVMELKDMPSVTKSVEVEISYNDGIQKTNLRKMIKKLYAGEEF